MKNEINIQTIFALAYLLKVEAIAEFWPVYPRSAFLPLPALLQMRLTFAAQSFVLPSPHSVFFHIR